MTTKFESPSNYFEFKPSLTTYGNDQWRKGGMTYNGLKDSTQSVNYFYGPGRQNLIPDPNATADLRTDDPSFKPVVSSIGFYQTNGLNEVASGVYGPGTLLATNLAVKNPVGISDANIGAMQSNGTKSQFVNYRNIDPVLVDNLRNNPLSIYAQGENVKNKPIPQFFSDIKPENYSTYVHDAEVPVSEETKTLYIDGSPQVTILGLAEQNPFLGLGPVKPNDKPVFMGKAYGGNDSGDASGAAWNLYNQGWANNLAEPSVGVHGSGMGAMGVENFGNNNEQRCQNMSLMNFAQGYNVAPQIVEDTMVVEGPHANNNLPWGPVKVTGNPRTQQGGIWQNGNNVEPTVYNHYGIQSNISQNVPVPPTPRRFVNPYKNGLPGTLVAN